jgi:hypothetical protein
MMVPPSYNIKEGNIVRTNGGRLLHTYLYEYFIIIREIAYTILVSHNPEF